MTIEEQQICDYLKAMPTEFVSAREICRRAGTKRQYRADPNWAKPLLVHMVLKEILQSDAAGHYRIRPSDEKKEKKKKWISPELKKILERGGQRVEIETPEEGDTV